MKKKLNESEYQQIKKVLQESGINTMEQLDAKRQAMFKSAQHYSLIAFVLLVIIMFLLPKYIVFTVMFFLLAMAWLWSSTVGSQHYFKRYIDEVSLRK